MFSPVQYKMPALADLTPHRTQSLTHWSADMLAFRVEDADGLGPVRSPSTVDADIDLWWSDETQYTPWFKCGQSVGVTTISWLSHWFPPEMLLTEVCDADGTSSTIADALHSEGFAITVTPTPDRPTFGPHGQVLINAEPIGRLDVRKLITPFDLLDEILGSITIPASNR
jgi:hypothetical protein